MISCKEAVGLSNKIGTCWNVAIQTNLFYGHNSEIVQRKLNEQSLEQILNPTVIENLERFLPPFLVDDNGKLLQRSLDIIKKIVINLKKRFDIKNKQKETKMRNAEEDVCERDFVYYLKELIYPGERNKEDTEGWGGNHESSFFLTNILDIILLNKLTHIVIYDSDYLSKGNRVSLNIDKIKSIGLYVHESDVPLDITDLTKTFTQNKTNHACQFFECEGTTKFSNNSTILEHDWRMFFKILNMLSVTDYETQKNDSGLTVFSEYDTTSNPLPKYEVWQNLEIGPYIITYDSELKPSIMYSFSPFFKKEKIINHGLILAEGQVRQFHFSYNISCTPENIKKLIGLDFAYYLSLKMMRNNKIVMLQRLFDLMDVNVINKKKETILIKGMRSESTMFVIEALKRINKTTLNYQDKDGQTALMKAVLKSDIESIKQIMKYEPDITLKDKNGLTALDHATELEIDLDDLNTYELPDFIEELEKLQKENPPNLFELTVLLDAYRNINETDVDGNTLLMHSVINNKHLEIVKEIMKYEPYLSIRNLHGHTALDIAKILNKQDVIKVLEEYASKAVNVKPPLLKPISTFNKELDLTTEQLKDLIQEIKILQRKSSPNLDDFQYFLDLLKDINETDYHGNTLLMHSVINNKHLEIVKEILKKNPNLFIRNLQGYTALDIANILNKQDIIKLLEEYASKPVNVKPIKEPIKKEASKEFLQIELAFKHNDLTLVKALLADLKDINETDDEDWTILMHSAAYRENIEIVKVILKKNPDLSIQNSDGQTALDLAKKFKNTDIIELLESYSSKPVNVRPVNVKPIIKEDKEIILELQEAIIADNLNRVKTLLDSLKDINEVNSGGWTIFHFIVFGNYNLEILKEILKRNPDLSIKTPRGDTTLELAKRRERTEMIEVLENYISKQVNVRPVNANVRPVNVKPKDRNEKCDTIDKLTVSQINELFKELKQPPPPASLGRLQKLKILKDLLGC
jgi:ankyrin repeat protein